MKGGRSTVLYIEEGAVFGGSLVVIANLMRCLDRLRFRAVIVAEMDRSVVEHHIDGHAAIHLIRHPFNYVRWARVMGVLRFIPVLPVRKAGIYMASALRRVLNLWYAVRLALVVLRERVDLIHVNNGFGNPEAALVAWLLRRKCIVHVHGVGDLSAAQRRFAARVPRVIAISRYVKAELVRAGVPEAKLVVIPNPVLPQRPSERAREVVRQKCGISARQRLIGIFGRVVRWKGQLELLQAFVSVARQLDDVTLVIVGDSADGGEAYMEALQKFVADHGLQGRVVFAGYIGNVTDFYAAMDVVVHASIEPEPFGLVITEAMAQGVPVVASSLGAPREIIDHGVDGLLVDPRKPVELAEAILQLLRDDSLRVRIGAAGRETVLAAYDAEIYAQRVAMLYEEVLAR